MALNFQQKTLVCDVCLTLSTLRHLRSVSTFRHLKLSAETDQLLEAIGVILKKDGDKAATCGSNYQDDITFTRTEDDNETCNDSGDCEKNVLKAISKVGNVNFTELLVKLNGLNSISFIKLYKLFAQVPKGGKAGLRKFGCLF